MIKDSIKKSLILITIFLILLTVIYPLFVTMFAQVFFKDKANGSIVYLDDVPVGSELIGQNFFSNKYFWSRPSATDQYPYNSSVSSGSNYGPNNKKYIESLSLNSNKLLQSNKDKQKLIPLDMVTSSASGLDPHISVLAAMYQAERVAANRGMKTDEVIEIIKQHSIRTLPGDEREIVNVLQLNIKLDKHDVK